MISCCCNNNKKELKSKSAHVFSFFQTLTLKGPGGGGICPPLNVSRNNFVEIFFFSRRELSWFFFFEVLRNFCHYFLKNRAYGSKVTQHVNQNLKIFWICVQNMENGFLCQNSILSSKMQYLLSLQLNHCYIHWYWILKQFHIKKTIKYIKVAKQRNT